MDGKIWVFGGQDALSRVVSSVFCFDMATTTWNSVNSSGPPRYGHSAVLTLDSTAMIVFGGGDGEQVHQDTWSFHFGTERWEQIPATASPPRRRGHSACTWRHSSGRGYQFISGGVDVLGPKNDVWMQDLGMLPVIEARTNATSGNVLLLFDVADSPNHRLVPVDLCTNQVKEELWLRFQFLHLIEVDSDGQALSNTTFPEYGFSLSKGRLGYQQTFDFSASLGNRTVGLNYSLYSNETYVSYGNVSLLNRPGTNKWNLLLSGWTFAQPTNRLEIYVGLSVQASVQSIVGVSAGSAVANQRTTRYVVQTTHTTSTMDLADFALADVDVDRPVQHRFEAADTLVLSLPTFTDRLSYDPNIGLLLRDQGNGDECSAGSISLWILCLIAAAVIIPCAIGLGAFVYVRDRRARQRRRTVLQARLKTLYALDQIQTPSPQPFPSVVGTKY